MKSCRSTILFIVISFSVIATGLAGVVLDKIIAVVGEDVITWSELYRTMEFELKRELEGLKGEERLNFLRKYEKLFFERVIENKLQLLYAKNNGIYISEKDINAAIADIRSKYGLSDEEFMREIKKEGFEIDEYRKMLGEKILIGKVINLKIKNKIIIREEEITEYMKKKPLPSKSPQYRIRQILLVKKDDDDYQILSKKADDLYERLIEGTDFRSLVLKYSDGPNATNGGDLGFIKKEDMSREFLYVIEKIGEGEISRPFKTQQGFHIIQLLEKRGVKTDKDLREEVRLILLNEKFIKSYREWIKSLKEKTIIKTLL